MSSYWRRTLDAKCIDCTPPFSNRGDPLQVCSVILRQENEFCKEDTDCSPGLKCKSVHLGQAKSHASLNLSMIIY